MSADPILSAAALTEPAAIATTEPTVISIDLLKNSASAQLAAAQEPAQSDSASPAESRVRHEVVFVDSRVEHYEQFFQDFLSSSGSDRSIEVRLLDSEHDGIEQISEALAEYSGLDAVHFISHGGDGAVLLGATWLDQESLRTMANAVAGWGKSLSTEADLLFYGCDLAASPLGAAFIEQLSQLTGADVAASVDPTGSALLGGDWVLESAVGSIETDIAPSGTLQQNWNGLLVNNPPSASNMNTAETYTLNTPLNLADIVVSDADSANVTARLTLSNPAAGRLSIGTSGSVTSTYNAATGVWTASGAIADVNALLANLTFTPSFLFLGSFTIATRVDDGVAPALTGVKNMSLALIDLPPTATNLNAGETYTEDTPLNLTNIVISDLDSPNVTARLTLSNPAAGSLNSGTSGAVTSTYNPTTGVWSASGAIADVNNLLAGLTFTPTLNYAANFTISTRVDDGVAAAITGVKNMTAIPVNDAPTASNLDAAEIYTVDQSLNLADIVISDVDSANVTARLTLSDPSAGSLNTATSGSVTSTYNAGTGQWVASGALADVNALLAGLTITPAPGYNSAFTIVTSVDDGVTPALTGTKNVSSNFVNTPPLATNLSAAETYSEDTPLDLADIVVSDSDSANVTVTLTLSAPAAGSLNTATSGLVTSTYNPATGVWTASGAVSDVNAVLAGLTFTPTLNYNTDFTIATSVDDGLAPAVTGTKNITGTAVNDAPAVNNLSTDETYTEDTPLNLTDMVVSDVDSANVTVTLTLSAPAAGSLNTATSGLVTSTYNAATGVWTASGAIVDVNTLLAGLTFTPALNYNSDFTIATSVDDGLGGTTTGVKAMTGVPVNDAPTASDLNAAETYTEDTPLNLTDMVVSDVDSANVTVTLTLSDTAAGSLNTASSGIVTSTYNSGTGVWAASGAIADVNTLLAGLTFTPALNYNSNFTIAASVDDGLGGTTTGMKAITGVPVNDAPTATNFSAAETYTEDTPLNLTDMVVSDVDGTDVTVTLTLSDAAAGSLNTGTSGSVTPTYNSGTGAWTASGAIADVNALLAGLTFTPSSNYNSDFTIAASVDDGIAAPVTGTKNMTGTAINDAPVLVNNALSISEGGSVVLSGSDISATDVDNASGSLTFNVSSVAGGQFELVSSPGVAIISFTQVQAAGGAVRFAHDGGEAAPSYDVTVLDGGTSDGPDAANITFINVNDAPVANNLNAPEIYTEDTPLNLTDIVVSDVDSANVTVALTLSDPLAGNLNTDTSGSVTSTYNAGTGVWTASGATADVNALLANLTFTPALNYNSNFTIATTVDDGVAPPITGVKNMTDVAVNDAPALVNNSLSVGEGGSVVLSGSDLSATDVDSTASTLLFTVSGVTAGQFELVSNPGVAVTSFTQAQVTSGAVRFVHNGGELAPSYDVTVSDGSLSDGPAAAAITFTNVNDAPTATNLSAAETYTEDTPLDLTDIVVSDVDSANVTVTLSLSDPSSGTLNTGTSGSVTSTYNSGTGVWTASGAKGDVSALLAGLTFTPALNYNSNFTIATSVDDGVAPAVTGTKNMTAVAVNDAPVLVNNSLTISEGESVVLSGSDLSATDLDNPSGTLTFTVSGVAGGRFELVSSPGVAISSFTQAQVTSGAVRFVHDGGEAAPSYDVTVSDGSLSDGPASAAITFANVNDAPVLVNNRLLVTQGESVLLASADLFATDVDNAAATLVFTMSGVRAGQFELVSTPGVAIGSFTQVQVTSGAVRFVHDGGTTTPSYDVTVSDGSLTAGPRAAAITFVSSENIVEAIPSPVPPPPITLPGSVAGSITVPSQILEPPMEPGIPEGSSGTGVGGTESSPPSTLGPGSLIGEFQIPNNSSTDAESAINPSHPLPSRFADKTSGDIREASLIRGDAVPTIQDSSPADSSAGTLASGDLSPVVDVNGFAQDLNKLRDEVAAETYLDRVVVGSSLTVATGFSIGYVLWLVRGEVLLTSLLASLPAWRLVDPLPVLSFLGKRSDEDEEDDSIEAAVKKGGAQPQSEPLPVKRPSRTRSVKWRMIMQPAESTRENTL